MNDPRGSVWNIWDLHVHTPYSLNKPYGDAQLDSTWERYIGDLENLNPSVKVLGINDYIFIHGYKKILEYKNRGRLPNIEKIFPVVELRINRFGGHGDRESRINFHVLFSDKVDPGVIESDFISLLRFSYMLSNGNKIEATVSERSLNELGNGLRREAVQDFGSKSDLVVGFNNMNLDRDEILTLLQGHYFAGKCLTAIGRKEWEDLRITQNVADKMDLANRADFIFTASPTPTQYHSSKQKLMELGVRTPLVQASDAHYFSDSAQSNRIGHSMMWIKADLTFEGLQQALKEKEQRLWVGSTVPPKLELINRNQRRYIESVEIRKVHGSGVTEPWFSAQIPMNPDLVAIIGNKGSGKSALADIIGLAGDTHNAEFFSFLNVDKFRKRNLASNFTGQLNWYDGPGEVRNLGTDPDPTRIERVKYIPQQYLERLCNEDWKNFVEELQKTIFSHVPEERRLRQTSLDDLIKTKTQTIVEELEELRSEMRILNEDIASSEERLSPSNRQKAMEGLREALRTLNAMRKTKPAEVMPVSGSEETMTVLNGFLGRRTETEQKIAAERDKLAGLNVTKSVIERVKERINQFKLNYTRFQEELRDDLAQIETSFDQIMSLNVDLSPLDSLATSTETQLVSVEASLNPVIEGSLAHVQAFLNEQIKQCREQLDGPQRLHQKYVEELEDWKKRRGELIGDVDSPDSIRYYINILRQLNSSIPAQLERDKETRVVLVKQIFGHIERIRDVYRALHEPVQQFIENHEIAELPLKFEAAIVPDGFEEKFISFLNQGTRGSFQGVSEGQKFLRSLIHSDSFLNGDETSKFAHTVGYWLSHYERDGVTHENPLENQLKKGNSVTDVYNYLYCLEYLVPTYQLRLGDKELSQLSPGERGALLLIFYLLIDRSDVPLVIDQPEENLDNQSVYYILVPWIRAAKEHRQIIMVTHNPNLAVVCDAEQIIHAQMDKVAEEIVYQSGSIENPHINKAVIDVLEGTMPAFRTRERRYIQPEFV